MYRIAIVKLTMHKFWLQVVVTVLVSPGCKWSLRVNRKHTENCCCGLCSCREANSRRNGDSFVLNPPKSLISFAEVRTKKVFTSRLVLLLQSRSGPRGAGLSRIMQYSVIISQGLGDCVRDLKGRCRDGLGMRLSQVLHSSMVPWFKFHGSSSMLQVPWFKCSMVHLAHI